MANEPDNSHLFPDTQTPAQSAIPDNAPAPTVVTADTTPAPKGDIDDFDAVIAGLEKAQPKPSAPKTEEPKKDETTLQTKPATTDTSKEQQQQDKQPVQDTSKTDTTQPPSKEVELQKEKDAQEVATEIRTSKKDFTGIPEEDKPFFDKMGLRSFDKLKPIYLEHKILKPEVEKLKARLTQLESGALPESYHEHPRAYTLTPEFERAAETYTKAADIVEHWRSQLAAVRAGEETYQEIHVDQSGNLVLSKPVIADKTTEAELMRYLNATEQQLSQVRSKVESIGNAHITKTKEAATHLSNFENTAFSPFAGEQGKKLEPMLIDTIKNVLHPVYHNNPLARGYAKAMIVVNMLGEELKKLKAGGSSANTATTNTATGKQQTTTSQQSDRQKAGPIAGSAGGSGGSNGGAGKVTFDQFEEVMGRR